MISDSLVDAGEVTIAVRDFGGTGRPVLLLHGAGSNLAAMTVLARALRPRHRAVAVDLRGHGRSADGPWNFDAALADLAAVAAQLQLDRPAVVGVSLGGMLAARWGERHPDCPGVVSLDGNPPPTRPEQLPGLPPDRAAAELARLHETFTAMTAARPLDPESVAAMLDGQRSLAERYGVPEKVLIETFRRGLDRRDGAPVLRPSPEVVRDLRAAMDGFDPLPVYAATRCPLLLVLATRDLPEQEPFGELYAAYRRWVGDRVAAVARATPRMRYLHLQDASHAMLMEQPDRLAGLITEFLAAR